MSKRAGTLVTLRELIDDIGVDATRFFLVERSHDTAFELDLDLAREQSQENPVYYIQYAHARCCSILAKAREAGVERVLEARAPAGLDPSERALVIRLAEWPAVAAEAAARRAPHRVVAYLKDLARDLHGFYHRCRVVGEATDVLTRSVANLQVTSQEQSSTITRQSAALQETAVTAQQIRQTSAAAAQRAASVMEVVARADEVSRLGEQSIESSLGGLSEIGSTVQSITGQIALLAERTLQISGITATVKDLADQSNMLALNAAIEAVRSGEHGKGFAVVAREIRSLADQSIRATARVREILDDVSRAIAETANMVAHGQRRMESGIAQVRASGDTLRNLSQMVKDSSGAVRDIASSVAQQNNGIGQIFSAIRDLNSIMEDATRRLDSNDRAVSDLKDVSDRVSGIVDTYRA